VIFLGPWASGFMEPAAWSVTCAGVRDQTDGPSDKKEEMVLKKE
jgi:hypothetical protein